jgi:hypothetical protein
VEGMLQSFRHFLLHLLDDGMGVHRSFSVVD